MTETEKTETFLTTQHYKAASSFGGAVVNVHKARCTAGRLVRTGGTLARRQKAVLFVLGRRFVSATL